MSSNTMLYTLIGLSILLLVCQRSNVIENFGMLPPRMVNVERVVQQSAKQGDFVEIPGTYQAVLNPRQAGMVDYGAFIRYNMPDKGNRADNMGSLGANEGFCGSCSVEGYSGGGQNVQSGYAQPSYAQQVSQMSYTQANDMLPVQQMGMSLDALGNENVQPIIYDRYIYANQKNPLYGLGDPIRGDLPIYPLEKGWFSPAAQPQSMLRDSALMVMGGTDNGTTKELMALKSAISGGTLNTGSGINYAVQRSPFASGAGGDINVTAFP